MPSQRQNHMKHPDAMALSSAKANGIRTAGPTKWPSGGKRMKRFLDTSEWLCYSVVFALFACALILSPQNRVFGQTTQPTSPGLGCGSSSTCDAGCKALAPPCIPGDDQAKCKTPPTCDNCKCKWVGQGTGDQFCECSDT